MNFERAGNNEAATGQYQRTKNNSNLSVMSEKQGLPLQSLREIDGLLPLPEALVGKKQFFMTELN